MNKLFRKLDETRARKTLFLLALFLFVFILSFFFHPTLSHAADPAAAPVADNPSTEWQQPPDSIAHIDQVLGTEAGGVGEQVRNLWVRMMQIVNSLVVLVLLFVAFAEILRLNITTYGIKKILPTLVLAVVAANFSYIICRFIVDIANVSLTLFLQDTDTKCITKGMTVSVFFKDQVEETIRALNASKGSGQSGGLLTALPSSFSPS